MSETVKRAWQWTGRNAYVVALVLSAISLLLTSFSIGHSRGMAVAADWQRLYDTCQERRAEIRPVTYFCVKPDGSILPMEGGTAEKCAAMQLMWKR